LLVSERVVPEDVLSVAKIVALPSLDGRIGAARDGQRRREKVSE
jgi:hypothetical protein